MSEPGRDDTDPGMYGSDVNRATDQLYEVSAWLHDVHVGDQYFDVAYDALIDRLIPTADAALNEVRRLKARVLALERSNATLRQQLKCANDHIDEMQRSQQ